MNMGQVVVLFIHRFIYGLVPLFELTTCSFWPLLVSYVLFLDYAIIVLTSPFFIIIIIIISDYGI